MDSVQLKAQVATQQGVVDTLKASVTALGNSVSTAQAAINERWSDTYINARCASYTGSTCKMTGTRVRSIFKKAGDYFEGSVDNYNTGLVTGAGSIGNVEKEFLQKLRADINDVQIPARESASAQLIATKKDLTDASALLKEYNTALIKQLALEGQTTAAATEWWKQNRLPVIVVVALVVIVIVYFKFRKK